MPYKKKSQPRRASLRTLVLKNNLKQATKKQADRELGTVITKKGRFTITSRQGDTKSQKGRGKTRCQKCIGPKTYNSETKRCVSKKSQKGRKIEKCKKDKISRTMREFRTGNLKTRSGLVVKTPPQAIAIALSIACKTC